MEFKRPFLVFILVLFFSFCLMIGLIQQPNKAKSKEVQEYSKNLSEIFKIVDENYVDPIDRKKIFIDAATAITERDKYSGLLQYESFTNFEETIEGNFVGIGIEYQRDVDSLLVTDVMPFSPAIGKVHFDDRIYSIDNKPIEEMDTEETKKLFRGLVDSKITLSIRRVTSEKLLNVVLTRKKIEKSPLRFSFIIDENKKIGYINISIFNNHLSETFRKAYENLLTNSTKMQSLIIDMRGNPGGGVEAAVDFCNLFLKSGLIVAMVGSEDGIRNKEEVFQAKENSKKLSLIPIYIMLDRESASAAELSSSCLRDYGLAKIFGEKSYGKGEAQTTFSMFSTLLGEYGIKITTAKFYTLSGYNKNPKESISGVGVIPDITYDFGYQETYLTRFKKFKRAWGLWNQELALSQNIERAKLQSEYFLNLSTFDPGLFKLIEIINVEKQ